MNTYFLYMYSDDESLHNKFKSYLKTSNLNIRRNAIRGIIVEMEKEDLLALSLTIPKVKYTLIK